MDEYIEKEAAIRALLNDAPEQVGYSREDAAECIRYMDAPMLPRCGMASGNATSHALFAEGTDLMGLTQIYGQIGNRLIAPTAAQRWTVTDYD